MRLLHRNLLALAFSCTLAAADVPGFTVTAYTDADLGQMTGLAWSPERAPRLFVALKDGGIRTVAFGDSSQAFADFSVHTNSECGLIGLAFDPEFLDNRQLYAFATVSAGEQRIKRMDAGGATATGIVDLITGLPTAGENHDGGAVGIGHDGKLYWAIGDLGNGTGVDADLASLAAKIGRANRDGSVPSDNPFVDGAGPNNDFVWARGFRNPFTFTFRPANGDLWVDTVGTGWEQVFVVGSGDHAGYNDYENDQPAGFLAPTIAYRTNGSSTAAIGAAAAVRSSGMTTFTTTAVHRLRQGMEVAIAGIDDASFNETRAYVSEIVSATVFRIVQAGPDATSGDGEVTMSGFGGAIGGGTFLDSSAFPTDLRGDFVFTDFNSGNLMRADLDAEGAVLAVSVFGTGFDNAIDVALGPDGAIYCARVSGQTVHRIARPTTSQALVVTPLHLRFAERGRAVAHVRLARAPTGTVTVSASRRTGDTDVSVEEGQSLTFTPANWDEPQAVVIAAAADTTGADDTATIGISSPGLATQSIAVSVRDEPQAVISSVASLNVTEGGSSTFTVRLARAPAATVAVALQHEGDDDIDASPAGLTFTTANWNAPQTVTVSAAGDADTAADTAAIVLASPGIASARVAITGIDTTTAAPDITSTPPTTAISGIPWIYDVDATGNPAPEFRLSGTPPAGMAIDAATGVITYTPAATGAFSATAVAENDAGTDSQAFTVTVAADQPPTASITQPVNGATVSGANREWFGDGVDDAGCVRADFLVDGEVVYTDVASGHFHVGGSHLQWDTRTLTNGTHTLTLRVFDAAGQSDDASVTVTVDNSASPPGPVDPTKSGGSSCGLGTAAILAALTLLLAMRSRNR